MTTIKSSDQYPVPRRLEPQLAELEAYWDGIKRGYGIMPYWDDVDMVKLQPLRSGLLLFDVMESQPRFRFNLVGESIVDMYGESLEGRFIDEIEPTTPFQQMLQQCRATVTESAPTHYRQAPAGDRKAVFARLLLPLWGNGQIDMLIGAIESGG